MYQIENMLKEHGIVTAVSDEFATVKTQHNSGCGGCTASCGTASLAKILGTKSTEIEVIKNVKVKVGDTVTIGINEQTLVKSALILYLLPLLTMFTAAIGYKTLAWQQSDLLITLAGLVGLLLGLFAVKFLAKKMSKNINYQPIICEIEHGDPF